MTIFKKIILKSLLVMAFVNLVQAQDGLQPKAFLQKQNSSFSLFKQCTDSTRSRFAIKTNPIMWATEFMQIQAELPVHKTGCASVQLGYRNSDVFTTMFDDHRQDIQYNNSSTGNMEQIRYSCKGFQMGIGYKQLFKNNWFLQSLFFYKQYDYTFASPGHWYSTELFITGGVSETPQADSFSKYVKGTTLLLGKTLTRNHLTIDIYGGLGYRVKKRKIAAYNDWGVHYTSLDENKVQRSETISLHLGVNIGFVFRK